MQGYRGANELAITNYRWQVIQAHGALFRHAPLLMFNQNQQIMFNKAAFIAQAKKQIEVDKDFEIVLGSAKYVAMQFDGKVVNKRFTDALNEAGYGCDVSFVLKPIDYKDGVFRVESFTNDRAASYVDYQGRQCTTYIEWSSNEFWHTAGACYIGTDKRLNAERFCESADQLGNDVSNRIMDYRECLERLDDILVMAEGLNNHIVAMYESLPNSLKDEFRRDLGRTYIRNTLLRAY